MRGSVCTGEGTRKRLEGRKCDAVEDQAEEYFSTSMEVGKDGRKFAYRFMRVCALDLRAHISDHVVYLSACGQDQLMCVF